MKNSWGARRNKKTDTSLLNIVPFQQTFSEHRVSSWRTEELGVFCLPTSIAQSERTVRIRFGSIRQFDQPTPTTTEEASMTDNKTFSPRYTVEVTKRLKQFPTAVHPSHEKYVHVKRDLEGFFQRDCHCNIGKRSWYSHEIHVLATVTTKDGVVQNVKIEVDRQKCKNCDGSELIMPTFKKGSLKKLISAINKKLQEEPANRNGNSRHHSGHTAAHQGDNCEAKIGKH